MDPEALFQALGEIEHALKLPPPIGAAELPPELRYLRVLSAIRDYLCPRISGTVDFSKKPEGDIVAILMDLLISLVGGIPLPVATVRNT